MEPLILVVKTILTRLLRLLVCIAIEAGVFKQGLALSPKNSVEYAASVNLFVNSVSWLIFFTLEPILPLFLKKQFIADWAFSVNNLSFLLIFFNIFYFIFFLILKWLGLELIRILIDPAKPSKGSKESLPGYRFRIIVKAHTTSHLAALFILLIKQVELQSVI